MRLCNPIHVFSFILFYDPLASSLALSLSLHLCLSLCISVAFNNFHSIRHKGNHRSRWALVGVGLSWVDSLLKLHKPVGSWTSMQGDKMESKERGGRKRREESGRLSSCWSVGNATDTQWHSSLSGRHCYVTAAAAGAAMLTAYACVWHYVCVCVWQCVR